MNTKEFCEKYYAQRKNTNCLKWDALDLRFGNPDLTALWVADMEFKSPEVVITALQKRIEHGVFGYSNIPKSYYQAFINWQKKHYNCEIKEEQIRITMGVVVSCYWFINAFTKPNDSVIILTPVYYPFHNAPKDTGRKLVTCELENNNGIYSIDFEKFERKIVENDVKMFIQCSPHNPVGRVWSEAELDKILSICCKHNVYVVSDEIHQDITPFNNSFIPAINVSNGKYCDKLITVTSASKTFNLAGLLNSTIVITNPKTRAIYDAYVKTVDKIEPNILGLIATETAYNFGEDWLTCLKNVIKENFEYIKNNFTKDLPNAVVTPLEGTYLVWVDLRKYIKPDEMKSFMQDKCKIAIDYGEWFSVEAKGFIRINVATHPKFVKFAVENIIANITENASK